MQYIIMNKEENRIQVESKLPMVFSRELSHPFVTSFNPVVYTNWVKAKWKTLCYSGKVIALTGTKENTGDFSWLQHKRTGRVYRVWNNYEHYIDRFCYKLEDNKIMVRGICVFEETDFVHFNFQ